MLKLKEIIKLSLDDDHITNITLENVKSAKVIIFETPQNNEDLVESVVAMNLINAALKRKEFISNEKDSLITYKMLKARMSRLFHNIIDNKQKFNIDFYISKDDNCAFIEIDDLQFSFHNIIIDKPLKVFINSPLNNPKPWKGLRLQKIAGELFDYFSKDNITDR
ncbi:hypothetical protein [Chryseobacterium sp. JAH]|uniref:hypothetical protein n=1 Tax=Chryseobacterium sp. JAH TaxID=1742858 RepID=UPI0007413B5E|nr:hypothetical protein [Chryseobacterium sp. JAH]